MTRRGELIQESGVLRKVLILMFLGLMILDSEVEWICEPSNVSRTPSPSQDIAALIRQATHLLNCHKSKMTDGQKNLPQVGRALCLCRCCIQRDEI